VPTPFAPSPAPKNYDPLLAEGSWGYQSQSELENSGTYTSTLHSTLEGKEIDKLTVNQTAALLKIFRNSSKVHGLIADAGGRSSEATYSITLVIASDDVGLDTPWVSATLRANFPTRDGQKGVQCYVYRQKTQKGLDNKPFVAGAYVGYIAGDGSLDNPVRKKL
jgi:hypothetical protein